MAKELLMGNEAIGLGAIHAGVSLVSGYPGTPSTEILETVARHNDDGRIHIEWSVNEKAALEVAAGGAYAGARTLVTTTAATVELKREAKIKEPEGFLKDTSRWVIFPSFPIRTI